MIHAVKGFSVVNEAEMDVFLEFPCFLCDPKDVGSLISGSSAFSKSSLNIWKFSFYVLLKPIYLEGFLHVNTPWGPPVPSDHVPSIPEAAFGILPFQALLSRDRERFIQGWAQQYVNQETPDVQVRFRKGRGTRDQIANICWIIEKNKRIPEKHLLLLHYLC